MSNKVCPKCGHVETDPAAKFCDNDGTTLVEQKKPVEAAPVPTGGGFPWWLILGGGGLALLGLAGWLLMNSSPKVDTSKTEVKVSTSEEKASTQLALPPRGSPSAKALKKCFGTKIPRIPRRGGSGVNNGFELFKDLTRLGTGIAVKAGTPKLTLADERRVGQSVSRSLEKKYGVITTGAAAQRLQRIVSRLVRVAHRHGKLGYTFKLLSTRSVNAFMAPGGKGFVFKGLSTLMPDDNDLAFIIGHELAHSELQHSADAVRVAMMGRKLGEAVGKGGGKVGEVLSIVSLKILQTTYDQDHEYESDRLGLCFSVLGGYKASGGVGAFKAMNRMGRRSAPPTDARKQILYDIMSSHPPLTNRMTYQKLLQKKIKTR